MSMEMNTSNVSVPMVNDVRRVTTQDEYNFYKARGYEDLRYLARLGVGTVKKRIPKAEKAALNAQIKAYKNAQNAAKKAEEAQRKAAIKAEAERIKAERKAARNAAKAAAEAKVREESKKVNDLADLFSGFGFGAAANTSAEEKAEVAAIDKAAAVLAGEDVSVGSEDELEGLTMALGAFDIKKGGKRKTRKSKKSRKNRKTRYNRRS